MATPASDGRSDNIVGAMKDMIQRQMESISAFGITLSFKRPLRALLVRHSEWTLNSLVRSDVPMEMDNRVIETWSL